MLSWFTRRTSWRHRDDEFLSQLQRDAEASQPIYSSDLQARIVQSLPSRGATRAVRSSVAFQFGFGGHSASALGVAGCLAAVLVLVTACYLFWPSTPASAPIANAIAETKEPNSLVGAEPADEVDVWHDAYETVTNEVRYMLNVLDAEEWTGQGEEIEVAMEGAMNLFFVMEDGVDSTTD